MSLRISAAREDNTAEPTGGERDLRFRLARLLRYSEEMLVCAQLGDWETVEAMERERRPELEDCFARALDSSDSAVIMEAVATLMHLNEQLVKLVRQAREAVVARQGSLKRGRSAAGIYRRVDEGL